MIKHLKHILHDFLLKDDSLWKQLVEYEDKIRHFHKVLLWNLLICLYYLDILIQSLKAYQFCQNKCFQHQSKCCIFTSNFGFAIQESILSLAIYFAEYVNFKLSINFCGKFFELIKALFPCSTKYRISWVDSSSIR